MKKADFIKIATNYIKRIKINSRFKLKEIKKKI